MYFITRPTASLVSSSSLNQSRSRASPSGHARAQGGGQVFLVHPQPVRARGGVLPKRQLPPERERESKGERECRRSRPSQWEGKRFSRIAASSAGCGRMEPKTGEHLLGEVIKRMQQFL